MAAIRSGSGSKSNPFARSRVAPYQRDLHARAEPIRSIVETGIVVDSPDFIARQLPDGRTLVRLKNATQLVGIAASPAALGAVNRYWRSLTIDHTKVTATLTDFPVLVSVTD